MSDDRLLVYQNNPRYTPLSCRSDVSFEVSDGSLIRRGAARFSRRELQLLWINANRSTFVGLLIVVALLVVWIYSSIARLDDSSVVRLMFSWVLPIVCSVASVQLSVARSKSNELMKRFSFGRPVYSGSALYEDIRQCSSNNLVVSQVSASLKERFTEDGNHHYARRKFVLLGRMVGEGLYDEQREDSLRNRERMTEVVVEELNKSLDSLLKSIQAGMNNPKYRGATISMVEFLEELSSIDSNRRAEHRLDILSDLIRNSQRIQSPSST